MMGWDIHPAALRELQDTYDHYYSIDPSLADDFYQRYLEYRNSALENPQLYAIRKEPVRRMNLHPRFGSRYVAFMIWNGRTHLRLSITPAKHATLFVMERPSKRHLLPTGLFNLTSAWPQWRRCTLKAAKLLFLLMVRRRGWSPSLPNQWSPFWPR